MLPRLLCVCGVDEGMSHFWSQSASMLGTYLGSLLTQGRLKHKSVVDFSLSCAQAVHRKVCCQQLWFGLPSSHVLLCPGGRSRNTTSSARAPAQAAEAGLDPHPFLQLLSFLPALTA